MIGLIEIPVGLFLIVIFSSMLTESVLMKVKYIWELNSWPTILYYTLSSLSSNAIFTYFFRNLISEINGNNEARSLRIIKIELSHVVIMCFVATLVVWFNFRGIQTEMQSTYRTCIIEKEAKIVQNVTVKKECEDYLGVRYKDFFNKNTNQSKQD